MSPLLRNIIFSAIASSLSVAAFAQGKSVQADAEKHVKRAIEYIKANGMEKSIAEFNNLQSPFNVKSDMNPNGDLYVVAYYKTGVQPVHGKNAKIPGKDVIAMKDVNGVPLIKNMVDVCFNSSKGSGWVDYSWPDPITNKVAPKRTFVEKTGDLCVGVGVYI